MLEEVDPGKEFPVSVSGWSLRVTVKNKGNQPVGFGVRRIAVPYTQCDIGPDDEDTHLFLRRKASALDDEEIVPG